MTKHLVKWHVECQERTLTGEIQLSGKAVDGLMHFRDTLHLFVKTENPEQLESASAGLASEG